MARQAWRNRFLILMLAVGLAACSSLAPEPPIQPSNDTLRLKATAFGDLPGWGASDTVAALSAFQRSCTVLMTKADGDAMGPYGGTIADWRGACVEAAKTAPDKARDFFEAAFTPVEIAMGDNSQGRFTGYFEPQITGSRIKAGAFTIPVYGRPADLIDVDLGAFRPSLKGEKIAGRVEGTKLVPYASRGDIEAKGLNAPVLFYTDDPVALFFLHIQGSGRVRFEDGSMMRVAYTAQNGQPYTAIGKTLIARGVPKEGMSLQVIRAWLKAHPEEAQSVMNSDASYVFFALQPLGEPALGAKGAQGVPLTPLASLAIDTKFFGLGTPLYVAGPAPLGRLFIGQDTGGAIRGAIRGDVYFGYGPEAEAAAGGMNQMGAAFALFPKAVAARLGGHP